MFPIHLDDRTRLDPAGLDAAPELFALVDANRDTLRPWLPWVDETLAEEDTRKFLVDAVEKFERGETITCLIRVSGRVAGVLGVHAIDHLNRKTEIGYWLGASARGQGLMTRACGEVVSRLFRDLELNRVEILCAPDNLASRGIPERLGFVREGVARQAGRLVEGFTDLVVYAMLAGEWREPGPSTRA